MKKRKCLWTRETAGGDREFRTFVKVLFSLSVLGLAVAIYLLLDRLGGTEGGEEIIVALAYGVGVLMVLATFLVVIISLIEYLRSLE